MVLDAAEQIAERMMREAINIVAPPQRPARRQRRVQVLPERPKCKCRWCNWEN